VTYLLVLTIYVASEFRSVYLMMQMQCVMLYSQHCSTSRVFSQSYCCWSVHVPTCDL